MIRFAPLALAALLSATASAGGGEAYFVKVDRDTTTQNAEGDWHSFAPALDATSTASGVRLTTLTDGSVEATALGDLGAGREILGWSVDGAFALIGVEPDEIDYDGGDPGGTALVGVEPDEIDYDGGTDPGGTALIGVEPDEIDFWYVESKEGWCMLRENFAGYVVLEAAKSRDGSLAFTPVHARIDLGRL